MYLREAAWGWYFKLRGDDLLAAGDYDRAAADCVAATELIRPDQNRVARADLNEARRGAVHTLFPAGNAAVHAGDPARAGQFYQRGFEYAATIAASTTSLAAACK